MNELHRPIFIELGAQAAATGRPTPIKLIFRGIAHKYLRLHEYTIKGYSLTAGVPNSNHFKLYLKVNGTASEKGGVILSNRSGVHGSVGTYDQVPLSISSNQVAYTHVLENVPRLVFQNTAKENITDIEIEITDEDDNAAQFSKITLVLVPSDFL